ncbi:MAG TPA: hypothetical protein VHG28_11155 [Longimicrobiaceae bacterium]|nr:hypothetical protein [Longimicrobiaceae bacterium]
MLKSRTASRGITAALVLVAAGCSDTSNPAGAVPEESPSLSREQGLTHGQSLDDRFAGLNRQVPGFGGYFYDADGNLNVYLTDPSQRGNAEAALASVLREPRAAARGKGSAAPAMVVRQGQYEFRQLQGWHERLPAVLALSGVVFTDIDEATNRLRIGVESAAVRPEVEARLASLGVPAAAVVVSETEPIRFLATLRDYVRPVEGAMQIAFGSYLCTMGANVYSGSTRSYITNSHCTNTQGGVESTAHYAPTTASSSYRIGTEVADPTYWTGGSCPAGRRCRYSDSSRGNYTSTATSNFGKIARTTSYGTTSAGSITIDAANPRFSITAEKANPVVGEYLDKIGRTTGWTYGRVSSTCANVNVSGSDITQLCQNIVGAAVNSGDSGSPVFYWSGSGGNVTFYGLLWGGSTTQFVFSSMANIERELGALSTF